MIILPLERNEDGGSHKNEEDSPEISRRSVQIAYGGDKMSPLRCLSRGQRAESREQRAESYIRSILLFALLTILVAYGFDTFRRTRGSLAKLNGHETYMIVSARPPAKDLELIALADSSERVEYLRENAAFASALRRGLKISDSEWKSNPVRVFSGPDRKMVRSETTLAALEQARLATRSDEEAGTSANLAVAAFLGVVAAFILRSGAALFRVALLGLSTASLYQILTACPTCPATKIVGIPAGLLGFGFYMMLFALSLIPQLASVTPFAVGGLCMGAAGWQTAMQLSQGTACVPCSLISFGNLYLLTSIVLAREVELRATRLVRLAWVASGFAVVATVAAVGGANATISPGGRSALTLSKVSRRPILLGMPIRELGLAPDPSRPVLMIVAKGCHPCDEAKTFFRNYPMPGLRTVHLGSETRGAEVTTRKDLISATPTFLFFDRNGRVREERSGWMDDAEWQKRLLNDVETISTEASAEGKQKKPQGT